MGQRRLLHFYLKIELNEVHVFFVVIIIRIFEGLRDANARFFESAAVVRLGRNFIAFINMNCKMM